MKKDIEDRSDIISLLEKFYEKAVSDPLIGHFFTAVISLDLEKHIPLIADFWASIVFPDQQYSKNVMAIHQHIHSLSPIYKEHLQRWLMLFNSVIEEMFEGPRAELVRQRAHSVATLMEIKFAHQNKQV